MERRVWTLGCKEPAHMRTYCSASNFSLRLHPRWKRAGIYTIQYLPAQYITDSSKQRRVDRYARVSVHVREEAVRIQQRCTRRTHKEMTREHKTALRR